MLNMSFDGLERLRSNAERLHSTRQVQFEDLFTPQFMAEHTKFTTLEEMMEKSGFVVNSAEDFAAIPDDEWDAFIRTHTVFSTWQDMLQKAAIANTTRELLR